MCILIYRCVKGQVNYARTTFNSQLHRACLTCFTQRQRRTIERKQKKKKKIVIVKLCNKIKHITILCIRKYSCVLRHNSEPHMVKKAIMKSDAPKWPIQNQLVAENAWPFRQTLITRPANISV